jgi:hypothetical protein
MDFEVFSSGRSQPYPSDTCEERCHQQLGTPVVLLDQSPWVFAKYRRCCEPGLSNVSFVDQICCSNEGRVRAMNLANCDRT